LRNDRPAATFAAGRCRLARSRRFDRQSAPGRLKRELRRAELRKKRAMALALIAPLAMFLLVVFAVPIGALLQRAVASPEVPNALPQDGGRARAVGPQGAAA
jgi:hypothetical protein